MGECGKCRCSNECVMLAMSKEQEESLLMRELKSLTGLKLKLAEPLARYTSMKIGGPVEYFIEVETSAALTDLLHALDHHAISFCLLGNSNNVLISDRGMHSAMIQLTGEFKKSE